MENVNETHFVINLDKGCTLGFKRDTMVKYAKVIFGGNLMTMVIKKFRSQQYMIEMSMLIFTNLDSNYPICALEDNILGICYKTNPKD